MDCADPVLFLWGRLWYYPGLTPLAKAITVALALTKTLHLQGEEEITPQ